MFCSKCGAQMQDGSQFCSNCGNKVGDISAIPDSQDAKEVIESDKTTGENKANFFDILPFKRMAEKIPSETRTKIPILDKVIPLANYIACGLVLLLLVLVVLGIAGSRRTSGSSSAQASKKVNFGSYPIDYELAYFRMLGNSNPPTVNELFGPDATFGTSFNNIPSRVTLESCTGNKNELNAVLLLAIQNPNTEEYMDAMRMQLMFQSDDSANMSYVRYVKIINLVSGAITEKRSSGNQMDDAELTGLLAGMLPYFWDDSKIGN